MSWLRRREAEPNIPTAPNLQAAIYGVLDGAQELRSGSLLVTALEGGGCALRPDDAVGGVLLAAVHLNVMRQCAAGRRWSVRLVISASLQNSRLLPTGTLRRTHPGYTSVSNEFRTEQEVQKWLKTPKGRAVARSRTLWWSVSAIPRRAR